ncbi:MAG: FtsQ-type POTRA domain-containing protein [Streptococcaceae bacterium]|nr:FtsQ-type POTRA domain-containing protein [Streptococcaceae bacterium]
MRDKNKIITNSSSKISFVKLTPWQEKHQEFMNAQSEKTSWQLEQEEKQKETLKQNEKKQEETENDKIIHYKSFQEKLPKLKKQRNKKLFKQLSLIFSVFVFSIFLMLYFISPFSKLEKIEVIGAVNLSKSEVIKASKLAENQSILGQFLRKSIYEKNIKKFSPRVSLAKIKISEINHFIIKLEEYREIAYELDKKSKKYRPILSTGKLMNELIKKPKSDIPKLKNFNSDKKKIISVMEECSKLKDSLRSLITGVTLAPIPSNPTLVVLSMKDGNEVKISSEDISSRLNFYPKIVKKMKENGVVNMEVGAYSYPFSKRER